MRALPGGHAAATDRATVTKSATPARPDTSTAPAGGARTSPAAAILANVTSPASYIPQPAGPKAPTTSAAVLADNCVEPLAIDVDHGDGTVVQINVATCLAWNGSSNPPAPMAITAAQAERIGAPTRAGARLLDVVALIAPARRSVVAPVSRRKAG